MAASRASSSPSRRSASRSSSAPASVVSVPAEKSASTRRGPRLVKASGPSIHSVTAAALWWIDWCVVTLINTTSWAAAQSQHPHTHAKTGLSAIRGADRSWLVVGRFLLPFDRGQDVRDLGRQETARG